jgi:DNA (cytosine-5)-methyltransferase 1
LELGVESATGGRVVWQVERDPWCRSVLAQHWPDATRFDDVRAVSSELAAVDLICGGFPCQPASVAGARKGMSDDRWLWPQFARIVGMVGPRLVLLENVPGLLSLDDGRAWGSVLGDLAARGYDAVWDVFRASDVGAPHRRERLFCLAYANGLRATQPHRGFGDLGRRAVDGGETDAAVADADSARLEGRGLPGVGSGAQRAAREGGVGGLPSGRAQPRLGGDADGLPARLDARRWPAGRGEAQHPWEPPRVSAKATDRGNRLRALGNAVVPQVAALALRTLTARAGVDL